jgi:ethanolamine utilization protein EutA
MALEELPTYQVVRHMAQEIHNLMEGSTDPGMPLYLVLDADIAKSLGGILKEELNLPGAIIAVDGIDVGDLDYVDIGRPMGVSESLPVTVKSLMFPNSVS